MNRKVLLIILALSLLFPSALLTGKDIALGEQIKWQLISSGGGEGTSTSYKLNASVGQTATELAISTSYRVYQGYWQNFETGSCCVTAGDADHNGIINLKDITFLIKFLYQSGPDPTCMDEGNADGVNPVNLKDITYLIKFLYQSGPAPKCP